MSDSEDQKQYRDALSSSINHKSYIKKDMGDFYSSQNIRSYLKDHSEDIAKLYSTKSGLDYSVLTLSICGNLNVGTIMRTAQLLGADQYIVFGKRKFDTRSTVGALKYMNVKRVFGLKDGPSDSLLNQSRELKSVVEASERVICPDKFYNFLIENKLVPVFLEQRHDAIYDDDVHWSTMENKLQEGEKFCFVFGNEGDGIALDVVKKGLSIKGSFVICIRQLGALQSFNVSAAAAIILSRYKDWKMKKRLDWIL